MNKEYHYDAVKDWNRPSNWILILYLISGLCNIILGIFMAIILENYAFKIISFFYLVIPGTILIFIFFRKAKPFLKNGIYTVNIADGIINWDLKLFRNGIKIPISNIKSIKKLKHKIEIHLKNEPTVLLNLKKIYNLEKRMEFEQIMNYKAIGINTD